MALWEWGEKLLRHLRLRQILPHLGENRIVCDLGCGDGSILKLLSSKIKTGYGIDREISDEKGKNLYFTRADITQPLPLESDKFDAVLLLAVLEHLESPDLLLSEIRRILKIGGRLILTTPASHSRRLLEFLAFRLKMVSRKEILDHKHYYSKNELNDLLLKFNFKILKIKFFEFGLNLLAVVEK